MAYEDLTSEQRSDWNELMATVEALIASGVSPGDVFDAVGAAESSLQADRLTAKDQGRPDPYPHLGPIA